MARGGGGQTVEDAVLDSTRAFSTASISIVPLFSESMTPWIRQRQSSGRSRGRKGPRLG
jgi:hypothetical protein